MPTKLARYSQLQKYEEAEGADVTDCMECGSCSYTCPAGRPLLDYIRLGKSTVIRIARERVVKV